MGPVVPEIFCLIKIQADGNQTDDRQSKTGGLFFHTLGNMKPRENIKVASNPMESITKFK